MPFRTPPWLRRFCKQALPLLHARADGRRMIETIDAIVATDRWTSFDQYHKTTQTLVDAYETAGAATEVYSIPTGGQIGSGRWTIQEAQDVRTVTVDVVKPRPTAGNAMRLPAAPAAQAGKPQSPQFPQSPPSRGGTEGGGGLAEAVRSAHADPPVVPPGRGDADRPAVAGSPDRRIADYRKNPWHFVRWSASTPPEGITAALVVVDTEEALNRVPANGLAGKIALTTDSLHKKAELWSKTGVAGLLVETPVPGMPDETKWTSFGWGGLRLDAAGIRQVAVAIPVSTGKMLRALIKRHGEVRLKVVVDAPRYAGAHDVAHGLVWGAADPQDEVWALAHSLEPGAADNASGVATCIEIAQIIESLIASGGLPRPKRTIRLLHSYECYGFFHYLEHVKRFQTPLAGVCIDCVGIQPERCGRRLEWHATIPMSAGFVDALGEGLLRAALRIGKPGYQCKPMPFVSTSDTLIGDPKYGFPCPWLASYRGHKKPGYDAYHSSADTSAILSRAGLETSAAAMAAYLYFLADADSDDVAALATWETQRTLQ